MKAFHLKDGFGIDNLALVDAPEPTPGFGEVLIDVKACSLNYRDLLVVMGAYAPKLPLPFQTLSDGTGVVSAVGEGVSDVAVGDRVAGAFMPRWRDGDIDAEKAKSALGGAWPGMAAEKVVLPADGVVKVPDHLSDAEAATLPCAAVTAWNGLVVSGRVKAGDTVLVLGTGGVSIFALQIAKAHGARVIATSSSDEKLSKVRDLGADHTINYKATPEWGKAVLELTDGRGVDHVVEVGGAGTLGESLTAVRMGGHIAMIGVLAGGTVNTMPILMKSVRVQGIYVGSVAMFADLNRALAEHAIKPEIDNVFPFAEYPDAMRHMKSGAHFGKIALSLENLS